MIDYTVSAYISASWVDITSDVFDDSLSGFSGIASNREADRIARNGTLSFDLKNNSGDYTPSATWKKGTPIKVVFSNGTVTKTKFIGRINSIKLTYKLNNYVASITALDWMYDASQIPLDIPALQTDKRADQIIDTIVGFSPIAPIGTDYQTGTQTFPYAFHDNTVKTTAYAEISKAALSEWGYVYVKQDGTLVFEANGGRSATQKTIEYTETNSGFLLKSDGGYLLLSQGGKILFDYTIEHDEDVDASVLSSTSFSYGDRMINRVDVRAYPYRPGLSDVLVYTNEKNQLIPAGETIRFRVQFTDQNSRLPIAAIEPTEKQTTLIHFDTPAEGVSGIVDAAEPILAGDITAFEGSGGGHYTNVKKFGTASYGFNGSSDYISGASQEKFNVRDKDFTMDWWEYRLASTSGRAAVSRDIAGGYSPYVLGYSNGSNLLVYFTSNGSSWDIANGVSMGSISTSVWTHYAITRQGDTWRTFKNGVKISEFTSSATVLPSTATMSIFRYGSAYTNGYIDELRIIKGYAEWVADFDVPVKAHTVSGMQWNAYTLPRKEGTDITADVTMTMTAGGVGLDFEFTNDNAADAYLNLDIYATPLESISPPSYIAVDNTSVNEYGYYGENVDMRLQQDIFYPMQIADSIIAQEKNPRTVLNSVSMTANKNIQNELYFLTCDIGDLVRVTDPLSDYSELNHIQGISWSAKNGDGGAIVNFDWILKEKE